MMKPPLFQQKVGDMGPAGHHGPDHLVHIQAAVDNTAAPRLEGLAKGLLHLRRVETRKPLQSICLGQLDEVGATVQGSLGEGAGW